MLDRETLRAKLHPLRTATVAMPSWGGDVCVRELSAAERFALPARSDEVASRFGLPADFAMACTIAVMAIVDDGEPVFTVEDIPMFSAESLSDLFSVAKTVAEMSALHEDIEGNSEGIPSDSSPSG